MSDSEQENNPHSRIAGWMIFGFWFLLFGMLILFFQDWLDKQRNPNDEVISAVSGDGTSVVTLRRNRYGHYNATGKINGHKVEFLLDTGATNISVPAVVADRIGLPRLSETEFYTANGKAKGWNTRIREARLGEIVLHDLGASINPNVDDEIILLGMTFLKQIEFTQRGNVLTLTQYPNM